MASPWEYNWDSDRVAAQAERDDDQENRDQQNYNTQLAPDDERAFQRWKARYAPNDSGYDYDLRGAYQAGLKPDAKTGHWPDTYKKPNHPTFSDQSRYASAAPDRAGQWDGDTYVPPKQKPWAMNWDWPMAEAESYARGPDRGPEEDFATSRFKPSSDTFQSQPFAPGAEPTGHFGEKEPGWLETFGLGAARSQEDLAQTYGRVVEGDGRIAKLPGTMLDEPISLDGTPNFERATKKALITATRFAPAAILAIAGGGPLAAGGDVTLTGASAGAMLGTLGQTLGPNMEAALAKYPDDPERAYKEAMLATEVDTGFAGFGALATGINPFGSMLKNELFQVFVVQPSIGSTGMQYHRDATGEPKGDFGQDYVNMLAPGIMQTAASHAAHLIPDRPSNPTMPWEREWDDALGTLHHWKHFEDEIREITPEELAGPTPLDPYEKMEKDRSVAVEKMAALPPDGRFNSVEGPDGQWYVQDSYGRGDGEWHETKDRADAFARQRNNAAAQQRRSRLRDTSKMPDQLPEEDKSPRLSDMGGVRPPRRFLRDRDLTQRPDDDGSSVDLSNRGVSDLIDVQPGIDQHLSADMDRYNLSPADRALEDQRIERQRRADRRDPSKALDLTQRDETEPPKIIDFPKTPEERAEIRRRSLKYLLGEGGDEIDTQVGSRGLRKMTLTSEQRRSAYPAIREAHDMLRTLVPGARARGVAKLYARTKSGGFREIPGVQLGKAIAYAVDVAHDFHNTVRHEGFHVLADEMGLMHGPEEQAVNDAVHEQGLIQKYGVDRDYAGQDHDVQVSEARAEWFAKGLKTAFRGYPRLARKAFTRIAGWMKKAHVTAKKALGQTVSGKDVMDLINLGMMGHRALDKYGRSPETRHDFRYQITPETSIEHLFESKLGTTLDAMNLKRASADQWIATLRNKGIKPEELQDTGLEEFLTGKGKEPVTRAEIDAVMAKNKFELHEIQRGTDVAKIAPEHIAEYERAYEAAHRARNAHKEEALRLQQEHERTTGAAPKLDPYEKMDDPTEPIDKDQVQEDLDDAINDEALSRIDSGDYDTEHNPQSRYEVREKTPDPEYQVYDKTNDEYLDDYHQSEDHAQSVIDDLIKENTKRFAAREDVDENGDPVVHVYRADEDGNIIGADEAAWTEEEQADGDNTPEPVKTFRGAKADQKTGDLFGDRPTQTQDLHDDAADWINDNETIPEYSISPTEPEPEHAIWDRVRDDWSIDHENEHYGTASRAKRASNAANESWFEGWSDKAREEAEEDVRNDRDWLDEKTGKIVEEHGGHSWQEVRDRLRAARGAVTRAPQPDRERFPFPELPVDPRERNASDDSKFKQYSLKGGKDYREILLTLPNGRADLKGSFTESHWSEPNVVAHARVNTFVTPEGKKVFNVDETQSDWHQKGRKRGYRKPPPSDIEQRIADAERRAMASSDVYYGLKDELARLNGRAQNELTRDVLRRMTTGEIVREYGLDPDFAQRLRDAARDYDNADTSLLVAQNLKKGSGSSVPDAPFKEGWYQLLLKRLIKMAVVEGADVLTLTPGDLQADRYSLKRAVHSIDWMKRTDGTYDLAVNLHQPLHNGTNLVERKGQTPDQIGDLLGKEMADKIIAAEGKTPGWNGSDEHVEKGTLSGDGLEVGGFGMKNFYNKKAPAWINGYLKKFGVKMAPQKVVEQGATTWVLHANGEGPDRRMLGAYGSREEAERAAERFERGGAMRGPFEIKQDLDRLRDNQKHDLLGIPITDKMRETFGGDAKQPRYQISGGPPRAVDPTETPAFKKFFRKSGAVDPNGRPQRVFHTTTRSVETFDQFDPAMAQPTNDYGRGIYHTDNAEDGARNYMVEGGDPKLKIERRAEELMGDRAPPPYGTREYDEAYAEAKRRATAEIAPHEGATLPMYVSMQKPFRVDAKTTLTRGQVNRIVNTLRHIYDAGSIGGFDPHVIAEELAFAERDGRVPTRDVVKIIKERSPYAEDNSTGEIATGELVRQAVEGAGFDGIIDTTVGDRFRGTPSGTTHYITFKPEQSKSVFNEGTWDRRDQRIRFQARGGNAEPKKDVGETAADMWHRMSEQARSTDWRLSQSPEDIKAVYNEEFRRRKMTSPGYHAFAILQGGRPVGRLYGWMRNGTFMVDYMSHVEGEREIPPRAVRELGRQLRDTIPGLSYIKGQRISGSRGDKARSKRGEKRTMLTDQEQMTVIDARRLQMQGGPAAPRPISPRFSAGTAPPPHRDPLQDYYDERAAFP